MDGKTTHQKSELYFLLGLLAVMFTLAFLTFQPFIYALIMATIFATVFRPIHEKALAATFQMKSLAAVLATVSVIVIVIVPITFLSVQVFQEAAQLYSFVTQNGDTAFDFKEIIPASIELPSDFNQYLKQGLNWLLQHLGSIFADVAKTFISLFIFLTALYYLFKEGGEVKKTLVSLSPLQDVHDELIFSKLELAVNSVVKGKLAVALLQGLLTGIGFAIFGISNAALWGSVTAVAALIPGIGTALVVVPAVLFLFLNGETLPAAGLLIWGVLAVGLVDNFLGPKLVERGIKLHPFLILLSILGGIAFFGPVGFLLGPLVLSLLSTLLEIYVSVRKEHMPTTDNEVSI